MHSLVQPNAWVALKLPSGDIKTLQVVPNTFVPQSLISVLYQALYQTCM